MRPPWLDDLFPYLERAAELSRRVDDEHIVIVSRKWAKENRIRGPTFHVQIGVEERIEVRVTERAGDRPPEVWRGSVGRRVG